MTLPITGTGTGAATITGQIDTLELPFQTNLLQYVTANTNIDAALAMLDEMMAFFRQLREQMSNEKPVLVLDPTDWQSTGYTSSLFTSIATALEAALALTGTGLSATDEAAMFARARQRTLLSATRTTRRGTEDIASRLPYSGMIADQLTEADRDVILAESEINRDIVIKQAELTYQMNRAKVKEAMDFETLRVQDWQSAKDRGLKAYVEYDTNVVDAFIKYYAGALDIIKAYCALQAEILSKSLAGGSDQITFENYLKLSKILADGQISVAQLVTNITPV